MWSKNWKHPSKCIFSFVGSEFSSSSTYMAALKVIWQMISSKVVFVPWRCSLHFLDCYELNIRLRFSALPCGVWCPIYPTIKLKFWCLLHSCVKSNTQAENRKLKRRELHWDSGSRYPEFPAQMILRCSVHVPKLECGMCWGLAP